MASGRLASGVVERSQEAVDAGPLDTPAATAAFTNVSRPFIQRQVDDRVHRSQIRARDLVAPLDQDVGGTSQRWGRCSPV